VANQIFFVVGHSGWGKSRTLKALTLGNHHARWLSIGARRFSVRRASNDREPERWAEMIAQLEPSECSHLILALCPAAADVAQLIRLRARYELYFWVMRRSYGDNRTVADDEIRLLRALGTVEVFAPRQEQGIRAAAFERFIAIHP